ncbi:MAG: ABC transporter substrate-binding protein [Thermoleophilia bacterium]
MLVAGALTACGSDEAADVEVTDLVVASTTSTQDSGLFDELLPAFEAANPGYRVKVNAVGTGEALKLGERCDADVVLVHAPDSEQEFVADGFGSERREVMYNDFVIVGPAEDPAGIDGSEDAIAAFAAIAASEASFITRGDDSGTHKAELKLWGKAGIVDPVGKWYRNIGQGMGAALTAASETGSYTLADRGTWLSMQDRLTGLKVVVEGDPPLFNQYGVIPVSPDNCPDINYDGALAFMEWLVSAESQELIGGYGVEKYGQALFVPNAKQTRVPDSRALKRD